MNEQHLSQLLVVVTDPIDVGSPPLADIVAGGQRKRRRRRTTVYFSIGAATAVAVGVAASVGLVGVDQGDPAPTSEPVDTLTCDSPLREVSTMDYFVESTSPPTPEEAAGRWVDESKREQLHLERVSNRHIRAFVLRPDGTAHTVIDLHRRDGSWWADIFESCEGAGPGS